MIATLKYYTVLLLLFASPACLLAQNKTPGFFFIGNGNAAECPLTSNYRGWMQMLPMFLNIESNFYNHSTNSKTIHAFVSEGYWAQVHNQLKEGDYVFIAFNDSPGTGGRAKSGFQNDLVKIIDDSREKKAIPVLFTPVGYATGNETASVVHKIASAKAVLCISVGQLVQRLIKSSELQNDRALSVDEAIQVAKIVARGIEDKIADFKKSNNRVNNNSAVLNEAKADRVAFNLKQEAAVNFNLRKLPVTLGEWQVERKKLREKILKASGACVNHLLPLDIHETGSIKLKGYTVKKIYFQTRPSVYATANLYVPEGKGPFPAVINMHGHWPGGKAGEMVQSCAHELALNGYVCLNIDAWGSGERTTIHGIQEYHGSNLGSSLMNIGETLLGNQLADNIRGVDLLSSLSYVNKNKIGATGASGGGNQTMWLSAVDERIKASMPVVSVGTFQSYVMGSNCICELLPGGLTFTEESGILALVAPRAVKICNALQDLNNTFIPSEMLRSYTNAKPIFGLYNQPANIKYQLFNTPHGYWPEMRSAMLGWFDSQLKGSKEVEFKKEKPFTLLTEEQLMVFPKGQRDSLVVTTAMYCKGKGENLSKLFYSEKFIDKNVKAKELFSMLSIEAKPDSIQKIDEYDSNSNWHKLILETKDGHRVSMSCFSLADDKPLVIILTSDQGKINQPAIINDYIEKGYGIVLADIWGVGENNSIEGNKTDGNKSHFHTISRAEWWLGHSILSEWINDINTISGYLLKNAAHSSLTIDADKELAVAALLQSSRNNSIDTFVLRTCPLSYILDDRDGIDFFNMAIHIPGILQWGDISLIAALSKNASLIFKDPVSISGKKIIGSNLMMYKDKFLQIREACKTTGNFSFVEH